MSVFIRVKRFAAQPRIFRIRSLSCLVGEDAQGIFTINEPERPFFEIYAVGERYLLRSAQAGFFTDDQPWVEGDELWLEHELLVEGHDYSFSFFTTRSESELAGNSVAVIEQLININHDEDMPTALISLAGASKSFKLLINIEFSIGSSPHDSIMIDMPGVAPCHFYIVNHGDSVVIRPGQGAITAQERKIITPESFRSNFSIVLEPTGFKVKIQFPERRQGG